MIISLPVRLSLQSHTSLYCSSQQIWSQIESFVCNGVLLAPNPAPVDTHICTYTWTYLIFIFHPNLPDLGVDGSDLHSIGFLGLLNVCQLGGFLGYLGNNDLGSITSDRFLMGRWEVKDKEQQVKPVYCSAAVSLTCMSRPPNYSNQLVGYQRVYNQATSLASWLVAGHPTIPQREYNQATSPASWLGPDEKDYCHIGHLYHDVSWPNVLKLSTTDHWELSAHWPFGTNTQTL